MSIGVRLSPGLPPMVPRIPEIDFISVNYLGIYCSVFQIDGYLMICFPEIIVMQVDLGKM